jgi:hypothetical protein
MPVHRNGSASNNYSQRRVARAWRKYARKLARWAWTHLVIRTDRFGTQRTLADGTIERVTEWALTIALLIQHFAAGIRSGADRILGIHVSAPDETCRWVAIDIDKHGDESAADNLRFARRILKRARRAKLTAVLIDSSGGQGGYHLWILLAQPIPMSDARRLVLWLARGWERFGLPRRPDLFPSNDRLTGQRCGSWLRLPGRHHKRAVWSRIWSTSTRTWLEGEAAIDALLALRGRPVDVAAIVPESFGRPVRKVRPARPWDGTGGPAYDHEAERELWLARDALRYYANADLDYDAWLEILMALRQFEEAGRELFHHWSAQSGKYDPDDLDRRWESVQGGDAYPYGDGHWITIATLFHRARDAGWPGPAVYGLHYPVDFREQSGPIHIVFGRADYEALTRRGRLAIGLPDRDQPFARQLIHLLRDTTRSILVIGRREPRFEPEPVARHLRRELDVNVLVNWPPEPHESISAALDAADRLTHREEED